MCSSLLHRHLFPLNLILPSNGLPSNDWRPPCRSALPALLLRRRPPRPLADSAAHASALLKAQRDGALQRRLVSVVLALALAQAASGAASAAAAAARARHRLQRRA
jgi:hypothetical protein